MNLLIVFGSIFGSILLLGILILIFIKLWKEYYWAKEVKQHNEDAAKLKFSGQNPLYQSGVTEHSMETRTPLVSST